MLKSLDVLMEMKRLPERPLHEAAARVFEYLLPVFAPRRFVYALADQELHYLVRQNGRQWNGEELTSDALTSCPPGDASELVAELRGALASVALSELWIGARGALFHRAPHATEPAWFGRWRMERSLHELVEISFGWCDELRGVEIRFPNNGYPLTTAALRTEPDGARVLDDGDPASASDNRARIFGVLAGLPSALGLARDEVRWELSGDSPALAGRYPEDSAAIDTEMTRLRQ